MSTTHDPSFRGTAVVACPTALVTFPSIAHGSTEVDHTVEPDTISANGVTVVGLPYHYTVRRVLDSAGNEVSVNAQGEQWRFRLPDGSTFSAGGRIDVLTGDIVGSFRDHDFSPTCAALGG